MRTHECSLIGTDRILMTDTGTAHVLALVVVMNLYIYLVEKCIPANTAIDWVRTSWSSLAESFFLLPFHKKPLNFIVRWKSRQVLVVDKVVKVSETNSETEQAKYFSGRGDQKINCRTCLPDQS